jgi:hypothetical protein
MDGPYAIVLQRTKVSTVVSADAPHQERGHVFLRAMFGAVLAPGFGFAGSSLA